MLARPHEGAFAYISAANKESYRTLIVQQNDLKAQPYNFRMYATVSLFKLYDKGTGEINDPTESNNKNTGYRGTWYFCKIDMSKNDESNLNKQKTRIFS